MNDELEKLYNSGDIESAHQLKKIALNIVSDLEIH